MSYYYDDASSEEDVSVECEICDRVFEKSRNWRANDNSMRQHLQTHYKSCPECGLEFMSRTGSKDSLRAAVEKHIAARHDMSATCPTCHRVFDYFNNKRANRNSMEEHMQVHKPKTVSCPVCGDQRFRSATNAVQHVESGACPNCPGRDTARKAIHGFIAGHQETRHMLVSRPQLQYNGSGAPGYGPVPDRPYNCGHCQKTFKDLSSKMQHEERSHDTAPRRRALTFLRLYREKKLMCKV